MSATVEMPATDTSTPDRSANATRQLCDALKLETLKPKELKSLTVALAEAASEEVRHNQHFRERILSIFQEVSAASTSIGRGAQKRSAPPRPNLTPIRHIDPKLFGPDKPLDPYLVRYAYGDDQLRPMLERFPASELKKAAAFVEERNPGTKPSSRTQKAALLNYIVTHVTESQER
jgi:hypothetical protein